MIILVTLNNGTPDSWHFYRPANTLNCLIKLKAIATQHSLPLDFHHLKVDKIDSVNDYDTARTILMGACMLLNVELVKINRSCSVVFLENSTIPPEGIHIICVSPMTMLWASLECGPPRHSIARGRTYPPEDENLPSNP